jgi:hypothetical protein
LEVMQFHSMKVRGVEVMWVERFVMEVYVPSNSNTWSEGNWHTTEISESLCIFVSLSERWRKDVNFVIESESRFSS